MPTVPPGAVFVGPDGVPVMAVASRADTLGHHARRSRHRPRHPYRRTSSRVRAPAGRGRARASTTRHPGGRRARCARLRGARSARRRLDGPGRPSPGQNRRAPTAKWSPPSSAARARACLRDLDVELAALLRGGEQTHRGPPRRPRATRIRLHARCGDATADDEGRASRRVAALGIPSSGGLGPLLAIRRGARASPTVCPARDPARAPSAARS